MNLIRQGIKNSYLVTSNITKFGKKLFSWGTNNSSLGMSNTLGSYSSRISPNLSTLPLDSGLNVKSISENLNYNFMSSLRGYLSVTNPYNFYLTDSTTKNIFGYDVEVPCEKSYVRNNLLNTTSFTKIIIEGTTARKDIEQLIANKVGDIGEVINTRINNKNISVSHINKGKYMMIFDSTLSRKSLDNIKKTLTVNNKISDISNLIVFNVRGAKTQKLLEYIFKTRLDTRAFPNLTCKHVDVKGIPVRIIRPSFINERGWELYINHKSASYMHQLLDDNCIQYNITFDGYKLTDKLRINDGYGIFDFTPNNFNNSEISEINSAQEATINDNLDNKYVIYSYVPVTSRCIL